jgi:hypothetical protein
VFLSVIAKAEKKGKVVTYIRRKGCFTMRQTFRFMTALGKGSNEMTYFIMPTKRQYHRNACLKTRDE